VTVISLPPAGKSSYIVATRQEPFSKGKKTEKTSFTPEKTHTALTLFSIKLFTDFHAEICKSLPSKKSMRVRRKRAG
jgi:hypothetical protein